MIKVILIAVAVIAAVGVSVKAEKIYGVDDLDHDDVAEIKSWDAYLLELNKVLHKKQEEFPGIKDDPGKILEVAKRDLGSGYIKECFRSKASQKKAFKLLISLEKTLNKCDSDSYEILARNYIAYRALLERAQFREGEYADVISKVLGHYQLKHAQQCRPLLKQKFAEQSKEIPMDVQDRVRVAFSDLTLYDFGFTGMAPGIFKNLVAVYKPSFTRTISRGALKRIAKNLQSLQSTPYKKPSLSDKLFGRNRSGKTDLEHLKPILDEHLFEPCKVYRKKLAKTLNEARIDAIAEDGEAQMDFIHGDENFYQALIGNRLCGSLLEGGDKLYQPIVNAWNEALYQR